MMVTVTGFTVLIFGIIMAYVTFNGSDKDEIHYTTAIEFSQNGSLAEAIAEFDEAISSDPESVKAFTGRGAAYYALGDLTRALQDFSHSIGLRSVLVSGIATHRYSELKNAVAEAYAGRALVHTSMGNDLEAQRDKARAVEMGYDAMLAQLSIDALKKERRP